MKLTHDRDLDAPIDRVWERAKDVRVVAAAFPGGEITSTDGDEFTGQVTVAVGPLHLTYDGQGRIESIDEAQRRAVIAARGKQRSGPAKADIRMTLHLTELPGDRTHANLVTDLTVNGSTVPLAGPISGRIAAPLVADFLDKLAGEEAPTAGGPGDLVGTYLRHLGLRH